MFGHARIGDVHLPVVGCCDLRQPHAMTGIEMVTVVQSTIGSAALPAMQVVTVFGGTPVLSLALVALICRGGWSRYAPLALAFTASACVVGLLKLGLAVPRPWLLSETVQRWSNSGGFGMPSGHAANSMVFFAGLYWQWRAISTSSIASGVALGGALGLWLVVIGVTRVYLGAHTVEQVVAGWMLGAMTLALVFGARGGVGRLADRQHGVDLLLAIIGVGVLLALRGGFDADRIVLEPAWIARFTAAVAPVAGEPADRLREALFESDRWLHLALLAGVVATILLGRRLSPRERRAIDDASARWPRSAAVTGTLAIALGLALVCRGDALALWVVVALTPSAAFVLAPIALQRLIARSAPA